jgi:hypothetical protein
VGLRRYSDRELYRSWVRAIADMPSADVAALMPTFTAAGVGKLRRAEPSRLANRTRDLMRAAIAALGNGASRVREQAANYDSSAHVDNGARVWVQRFLLRLTEAGVSEPEVDAARMLLTRSHLTDYLTGGANAEQDLAPEDRLRSLRAVAEHVIIPTLRRRGRKVDASLTR